MKRIQKPLLALIVAGMLIVAIASLFRPLITQRRIEVHLAEQAPGSIGPIFDAIHSFDRPTDVLGALWMLSCSPRSKANESAGFILGLIAMKELSLAVPLEISEDRWWRFWKDFLDGLKARPNLTETERLVLGRIESARPQK